MKVTNLARFEEAKLVMLLRKSFNHNTGRYELIDKLSQPGYQPTEDEIDMVEIILSGKLADPEYLIYMEDSYLIHRLASTPGRVFLDN